MLGTSGARQGARRDPSAPRHSLAIDTDAEAGQPVLGREGRTEAMDAVDEIPAAEDAADAASEANAKPDWTPSVAETSAEAAPENEAPPRGEAETERREEPVESARLTIIGFLGNCLSHLEREDLHLTGGRLDGFNAFGCNLFLAGACESIAKSQSLSEEGFREVLEDSLELLNRNPERAGRFSTRYEEYLLEPGYCDMFEAGREALAAFMEEEESGDDAAGSEIGTRLADALNVWNREEVTPAMTGTVAVMFTKIVGADEFMSAHGDAAARELTAAHDTVVRSAIEDFEGREIKHLGDGIMASFPQTSAAVEAAIRMQREAHRTGGEGSAQAFGMCIGVNAGEPIAEDDDLFGTTVQIAARMCAAAAEGEIMVSNAVRAICDGKTLSFADLGPHSFKGLEEPVTVYTAAWQSPPED